ncbi:hypothetical protein TEA_019682 [Camellia sinensis var. sinensis]|uniref:Acyclic terpene utilisation N-terminal domain-containing protein n=1 Tax=Camellia sinensis var. sinensis TaxID=542762 RepID=A0A4S4DF67_CAMSN|nr:hypothetical protein TEA_019682 [Camellia sinensis var. sinensis]
MAVPVKEGYVVEIVERVRRERERERERRGLQSMDEGPNSSTGSSENSIVEEEPTSSTAASTYCFEFSVLHPAIPDLRKEYSSSSSSSSHLNSEESDDDLDISSYPLRQRANPQMRREKVHIGCGAGFGGDRPLAALKLLQRVDLNYIVLECLAERTLADLYHAEEAGGEGYDPRKTNRNQCRDSLQSLVGPLKSRTLKRLAIKRRAQSIKRRAIKRRAIKRSAHVVVERRATHDARVCLGYLTKVEAEAVQTSLKPPNICILKYSVNTL